MHLAVCSQENMVHGSGCAASASNSWGATETLGRFGHPYPLPLSTPLLGENYHPCSNHEPPQAIPAQEAAWPLVLKAMRADPAQ